MDALLCGDDSYLNVAKMMKEVQRVLKIGGVYMMITYGSPEDRINHLYREHLSFELLTSYIIEEVKADSSPPELAE